MAKRTKKATKSRLSKKINEQGSKKKKKATKSRLENKKSRVTKKVKEKENRQAAWFIFWIVFVFALFLGVYFYVESNKKFEYGHADWTIEQYEQLTVYHGRFPVLSGQNLNYNIYLRHDPRENDVSTKGDFSSFKFGGYLSISPLVDQCRGDFSRAVVDLGAFLKTGVGVGPIEAATTDIITASEQEKEYVDCNSHPDRTVIILEQGETSHVEQNEDNPYCYTIYIEDCSDIQTIEKFMIQSIDDFKERYQS